MLRFGQVEVDFKKYVARRRGKPIEMTRKESEVIVEAIFALNAEHGTTLVLVTHDLEIATRAQRIVRLRGGRVVEEHEAKA